MQVSPKAPLPNSEIAKSYQTDNKLYSAAWLYYRDGEQRYGDRRIEIRVYFTLLKLLVSDFRILDKVLEVLAQRERNLKLEGRIWANARECPTVNTTSILLG
jgi:hypothetical protein